MPTDPKAKRTIYIIAGIVIVIILWALFRPELLFVKKSVDEPLPGATSLLAVPQQAPATVRVLAFEKNIAVSV